MKKISAGLLLALALFALSACGKETVDYSELYERINSLTGSFSTDYLSYQVELKAEDKKLTLHNEGEIELVDGTYTCTYSHERLNRIGSGEASLVSSQSGVTIGKKEELLSSGFSAGEDIGVIALNLKDSFKTHTIAQEGDTYVMTGYIARNAILRYTDHLDEDIRFNYRLTVNSAITKIEKLEISYVTGYFDSVVITVLFKEPEK